jgi:alanyl aminopeptidase
LLALSAAEDPVLSALARELALDPVLRDRESINILTAQVNAPQSREVAWSWMKDHYDAIVARMPKRYGGLPMLRSAGAFCDEAHAADLEAFFAPKAGNIEGAPRVLASTLEKIRLCAARRKAYAASAQTLFSAPANSQAHLTCAGD